MIFSIITPTYNRANKLHRVFKSIKNQTLQKINGEYIFEWIIIDDGSTDNTKEVIEKWQKEVDFPIIYKYQENRGKPFALKAGIDIARFEWTLMIDSDDAFVDNTFEYFYEKISNLSSNCVEIAVLCKDQYGNIFYEFPFDNKYIPILKFKALEVLETWSIIKSEVLKKSFNIPKEFKGLKFIPESFFWNKLAIENQKKSVLVVNKVLRVYFREENSLSSGIRLKYPEGFLYESWYFINNIPFVKFRKKYLKHCLKYIIYSGLLNKNLKLNFKAKFFIYLLYPFAFLIKNRYLKGN